MVKRGPYALFFKRLLDIICSLLVLVMFCWLYAILAIMVRIKLGSPVLFKQERPGRIDPRTGKEKIFCLYKFRTMVDERDENGELLPDDVRLTKFGVWLRSTSLDEIPELFNILKGDMSLIGPRPLLVRYLERYNEEQRHRHDVRPGLTGYAQAHGRNSISWEDKFAMDVWYTKNVTLAIDVRILIDTIYSVLKKEGINSSTAATMEEFMGTPECVKSTWQPPKKGNSDIVTREGEY
jgi:lipopolysaccharide/colanic/teichoic acid biosynthesis glycosyltransferase